MQIIFAILLALVCPKQANKATTHNHHAHVITMDDDTGGETGRIPPDPPTQP